MMVLHLSNCYCCILNSFLALYSNNIIIWDFTTIGLRDGLERRDFTQPIQSTEIGKKAWLFAKLQPGRARKRNNAT